MLAYLPALLFVAVAAARASPNVNTIIPRSALSSMKIKEAGQVCEPSQRLVCCDETDECGEVDIGQINKSDFLYEHCTATVVCCDFDTELKDVKIWGDFNQNCIYVGNIA